MVIIKFNWILDDNRYRLFLLIKFRNKFKKMKINKYIIFLEIFKKENELDKKRDI